MWIATTSTDAADRSWIRQQCRTWLERKLVMGTFNRENLPVLPRTQAEVKQVLIEKQIADEERAMQYLANDKPDTSVARNICRQWRQKRQVAKERHTVLSHSRTLHVNLNNLLCATRFKMVVENKLVLVRGPTKGCGQQDSWEHLLVC